MAQVIVIDDQADIREVLKTALEEGGHEVRVAAEGAEALRLHAEAPADVVVTDLHMPGLNGLETVRALRERSAAVKIIAMTGADSYMVDRNLESSVIHGADITLTKPFPLQQLQRTIATLLRPPQT